MWLRDINKNYCLYKKHFRVSCINNIIILLKSILYFFYKSYQKNFLKKNYFLFKMFFSKLIMIQGSIILNSLFVWTSTKFIIIDLKYCWKIFIIFCITDQFIFHKKMNTFYLLFLTKYEIYLNFLLINL